jgi:hypothetical protein
VVCGESAACAVKPDANNAAMAEAMNVRALNNLVDLEFFMNGLPSLILEKLTQLACRLAFGFGFLHAYHMNIDREII